VKERIALAFQGAHARDMRRQPTDAERKFWWAVCNRQLGGFKFKRQYPIGPYIADFACLEAKLIVELDGDQHVSQLKYDNARDAYLECRGFRVLRIPNCDFLKNKEGVLDMVGRALSRTTPSP